MLKNISLPVNPSIEELQAHAEAFGPGNFVTPITTGTLYEFAIMLTDHTDDALFDQFHAEMTQDSIAEHLPNRPIECSNFRPLSRATNYLMTVEEAARVAQDPRVIHIDRTLEAKGISFRPYGYGQTSSYWDKGSTATNQMRNWGLYRSGHRAPVPNWGSDGDWSTTGTFTKFAQGYDVDVVICDGHIDPNHPEYAVNPDGTGGSRVVQFNWFSLNPQVNGSSATVYDYNLSSADTSTQISLYENNGHGHHVAGIACGNTNGWANGANIYNLYPYGEMGISSSDLYNYIRVWHANKPVNTRTGRKNPTIVNCSFGASGQDFAYTIDTVEYRGSTTTQAVSAPPGQTPLQANYNGNWDPADLSALGVRMYKPYLDNYGVGLAFREEYDAALAADVLDAANEGILTAGAAGNSWNLQVNRNDNIDYNNSYWTSYNFLGIFLFHNFFHRFQNRGSAPASAQRGSGAGYEEVLCVGNLGSTVDESVAYTSSVGDKVNVFAPGENIMSAFSTGEVLPWYSQPGIQDSRNSSYYLDKLTGTSMASPQVTGIVATALETNPDLTMKQAIQWIADNAEYGLMWEPTSPAFNDDWQLRGAPNAIINYTTYVSTGTTGTITTSSYIRPIVSMVYPALTVGERPTVGTTYPRSRIRFS